MMRKQKVLIIDDEQMITSTLVKLLNRSGYEAAAVNGGREAIEMASQEDFDLIISDIRMPEMDGIRTLVEIQAHLSKTGQSVPVIFITGYADDALEKQAKDLGCQDYIYKPFDLRFFLEKVKKAIG